MTEQEIFEYLKNNLYLDYDKGYSDHDVTIKLKLRPPQVENGFYESPIELGCVFIEVPISKPRFEGW